MTSGLYWQSLAWRDAREYRPLEAKTCSLRTRSAWISEIVHRLNDSMNGLFGYDIFQKVPKIQTLYSATKLS